MERRVLLRHFAYQCLLYLGHLASHLSLLQLERQPVLVLISWALAEVASSGLSEEARRPAAAVAVNAYLAAIG